MRQAVDVSFRQHSHFPAFSGVSMLPSTTEVLLSSHASALEAGAYTLVASVGEFVTRRLYLGGAGLGGVSAPKPWAEGVGGYAAARAAGQTQGSKICI